MLKIGVDGFQNSTSLPFFEATVKPCFGIAVVFAVVATIYALTQRHDVPGYSSWIVRSWIGKRYPMVGGGKSIYKNTVERNTANSTATTKVAKRVLPVFLSKTIGKIHLARTATIGIDTTAFGVLCSIVFVVGLNVSSVGSFPITSCLKYGFVMLFAASGGAFSSAFSIMFWLLVVIFLVGLARTLPAHLAEFSKFATAMPAEEFRSMRIRLAAFRAVNNRWIHRNLSALLLEKEEGAGSRNPVVKRVMTPLQAPYILPYLRGSF